MTVLTNEEQTFIGTVQICGMTTHWTSEATIVGVYLDGYRPMQEGFIGNQTLQQGTPYSSDIA